MPARKSSVEDVEEPVHFEVLTEKDSFDQGRGVVEAVDFTLRTLKQAMLPLSNGQGYEVAESDRPWVGCLLANIIACGTFSVLESGCLPTGTEMSFDEWMAYNRLAEVVGLSLRKLQIEWQRLFDRHKTKPDDTFEQWENHLGEIARRALARRGVPERVQKVLESWPRRASQPVESPEARGAKTAGTTRESAQLPTRRASGRQGKPKEHQFRAYHLWIILGGGKRAAQKELAGFLRREYNLSAKYEQSRFSKDVRAVKDWLARGKTFPATLGKRWDSLPAPWEQVTAARQ